MNVNKNFVNEYLMKNIFTFLLTALLQIAYAQEEAWQDNYDYKGIQKRQSRNVQHYRPTDFTNPIW